MLGSMACARSATVQGNELGPALGRVAPTCNNNVHFSMQCGLRLRPRANGNAIGNYRGRLGRILNAVGAGIESRDPVRWVTEVFYLALDNINKTSNMSKGRVGLHDYTKYTTYLTGPGLPSAVSA
jgi:hypothetical protein